MDKVEAEKLKMMKEMMEIEKGHLLEDELLEWIEKVGIDEAYEIVKKMYFIHMKKAAP
ncbi:MAG: hypothetical protein RR537_09440 [Longicatena sp.]